MKCADCRHWNRGPEIPPAIRWLDKTGTPNAWGDCQLFGNEMSELANIHITGHDGDLDCFATHESFGCVEFKAQSPAAGRVTDAEHGCEALAAPETLK